MNIHRHTNYYLLKLHDIQEQQKPRERWEYMWSEAKEEHRQHTAPSTKASGGQNSV